LNASFAPVFAAILAPIVTATVTTLGIAIQRRRSDRDLEARRLKLIEVARSQIQAVEPLLNSPARAGTPDDTRDRVHMIVTSALDALLRAEALTVTEERDDDRSILRDLLLFRHFDTRGARALRVLYHFSLFWLTVNIWVAAVMTLNHGYGAGERVMAAVLGLVIGVAPLAVIRSWALRHERRRAPAAAIEPEADLAGAGSAPLPSE
jgi:hypothetical protein